MPALPGRKTCAHHSYSRSKVKPSAAPRTKCTSNEAAVDCGVAKAPEAAMHTSLDGRMKRKRTRTPSQHAVLDKWWADLMRGDDISQTYVSKQEKSELACKAGLDVKQVDYFLWGKRRKTRNCSVATRRLPLVLEL